MLFRYRHPLGLSLCVLLALILSACNLTTPPQANEQPILVAPTQSPVDTPAAPAEQPQYTSEDFGFSLSLPAGFEAQSSSPSTVVFLAPQGTSGQRERGWLTVEYTSDENAGWYADRVREDNANLGIEITYSEQILDGQQSYVLGRVPGQDLNRQVFIIKDGMLYRLWLVPDDPAAGETYQQMESLYASIIGSLRFLPEHRAVPPVTDITNMVHLLEQALNARSADHVTRLLGDEFALGYLSPETAEGLTFTRHAPTDAVPLMLNDHLSQVPALTLQYQVDWASVPGTMDSYSGYFPGEDLTPILASGWGPTGADRAVILIARRSDGSLFWRGVFVLQ